MENAMGLIYGAWPALEFLKNENQCRKSYLRVSWYFPSIRDSNDLNYIIRNSLSGMVTLTCPHVDGYCFDGCSLIWLTSLKTNPNTIAVYLARVLDHTGAMHAICIDARTKDPIMYDCAKVYAMKLSVSNMRICFGEGNPSDFYRVDDDRRVVLNVNTSTQRKDKSELKHNRFQDKEEKKVEKRADKLLRMTD